MNQPPLTLEQAKSLHRGQIVYSRRVTYKNGFPCRVRVNGQPKTWKRDPERVSVPFKYGLWDYGHITEQILDEFSLESGVD